MKADNEVTFGLVHGAWHGAWCWEYVQKELAQEGYDSVAMDLPIEDPEATFDDYASVVVDSLADAREVVLVGHSRAGNIIPRAAGKLATKKLIFLCSSLEPATIGHPTELERIYMPQRNIADFFRGQIPLGNNMYAYDKAHAKSLFFHDCSPEAQEWAVNKFRIQRRSPEEPVLESWPKDIPQEYVICRDDIVINPEWSRYACRNWLDIEPTEIDGGHSPFLSRPRQLARLLIQLTAKD